MLSVRQPDRGTMRFLAALPLAPKYSVAPYPIPKGPSLGRQECRHCHGESGVSRWDLRSGALAVCPHCNLRTGRPWSPRSVLGFTLLTKFVSLFFTMRPKPASSSAGGWLCFWVAGGWQVEVSSVRPALEVPYLVLGLLQPIVINATVYVRHEIDLDASEPVMDRA